MIVVFDSIANSNSEYPLPFQLDGLMYTLGVACLAGNEVPAVVRQLTVVLVLRQLQFSPSRPQMEDVTPKTHNGLSLLSSTVAGHQFYRCFPVWQRHSFGGEDDAWSLVPGTTTNAHQCAGPEGRLPSYDGIPLPILCLLCRLL